MPPECRVPAASSTPTDRRVKNVPQEPAVPALQVGITLVAAYALATRLFPRRVGEYDGFAGYRLSEPLVDPERRCQSASGDRGLEHVLEERLLATHTD